MSIFMHLNLAGECVQTTTVPLLCLRLETPRERIALPYASLTSVELSTNEATLILGFVTHRVTVKGRKVSSDSLHAPKPAAERMAIDEIRIHPVSAEP
jgi:hypothetical protein